MLTEVPLNPTGSSVSFEEAFLLVAPRLRSCSRITFGVGAEGRREGGGRTRHVPDRAGIVPGPFISPRLMECRRKSENSPSTRPLPFKLRQTDERTYLNFRRRITREISFGSKNFSPCRINSSIQPACQEPTRHEYPVAESGSTRRCTNCSGTKRRSETNSVSRSPSLSA
jgi:hypothetical protein